MTRKRNHLILWNRDHLHIFFFFFVFFAWKCDLLRLFRTHTREGEGADCLSLTIWVSCINIDAKGWRDCGQIILKPITKNQFPLQWIWDGKYQSQESDTTEWLHFHFSLSCSGEGNGNPLQCSCLENARNGGAWWAAIYGVAQSRTWLKRLSSSSSSSRGEIIFL